MLSVFIAMRAGIFWDSKNLQIETKNLHIAARRVWVFKS